ncbi:MAG: Fur family transcriptional regulator [Solirubrobacteraceae bacterium]
MTTAPADTSPRPTGDLSAEVSANSWATRAEAALAAAGRRSGAARHALLLLLGEQSCALTATEIEQELRARSERPVSRASVYRILDELVGAGVVARVETGQGVVRYERSRDAQGDHHHHLVCDTCGMVMPFADEALERAIDELSERVPLAVSEHEIVLHGACNSCAS